MLGETSLLEIIRQGGFFMGLVWLALLSASVISWAVAVERFLRLRAAQAGSARLGERVIKLVTAGNLNDARALAQNEQGALARLFQAGLAQPGKDRSFFEERLRRASLEILEDLERRLPLLATIGAIAPFVGLFGTVLGIIRAFRHLGAQGEAAGAAAVSAGIAEALVATAAGLGVAIVAVLLYNYFQSRLQGVESRLERAASELSEAFYDRR